MLEHTRPSSKDSQRCQIGRRGFQTVSFQLCQNESQGDPTQLNLPTPWNSRWYRLLSSMDVCNWHSRHFEYLENLSWEDHHQVSEKLGYEDQGLANWKLVKYHSKALSPWMKYWQSKASLYFALTLGCPVKALVTQTCMQVYKYFVVNTSLPQLIPGHSNDIKTDFDGIILIGPVPLSENSCLHLFIYF